MRALDILVGLGLAGLLVVGCIGRSGGPGAAGKPAAEIEGEDSRGKPFQLADYRGKVVLLEFWMQR
jgi:hypothetical protein